jgi:hypothetical protein
MDYYDIMQVCKKRGHKITAFYSSSPHHGQKFCEKCGSETVIRCLYCNTGIRGYYHVKGVIGFFSPSVPLNCHQCGKPYPWARRLRIINFLKLLGSPIKYAFDSFISIWKKK